MVSRRRFLARVGGVGVVSVVAACAPSAVAPQAPAAKVEGFLSPGVGAPKRGGTFTLAYLAPELSNWDPVQGGLPTIQANGWPAPYEPLMGERARSFGDTEKGPGLAESWEISNDKLTYTFKIRKGVKWHNLPPVNGRELVAEDVAWTYRNYAANSVQKAKYGIVDKITVPDKYTVVFTLKNPFAPFLVSTLASDFLILPRETYEKQGSFVENPVGTGPWILERWDRGSAFTFKANPDYWKMGADGKPLPYASGMKIFIYQDQAAINAAIRANQVDYFLPSVSGVDYLTYVGLKKDRPDLLFADAQLANFSSIAFNYTIKPWDNVRLRRAISLGIDKDELIATAIDGDTVRSGFIPPPLTDYAWTDEKVKSKFPYDPKAAAAEIKALGLEGKTFPILPISTTQEQVKGVQVIVNNLTSIGLKPTIDMPASVQAGGIAFRTRKFEVGYFIGGTSFEVDDWVSRYWHSKGPQNNWTYSNPEVDRLADLQIRESDVAKRKPLIEQVQDLLYTDMALVPLAGRPTVHKVVHPRLKNVRNPHYMRETFAEIWIDG